MPTKKLTATPKNIRLSGATANMIIAIAAATPLKLLPHVVRNKNAGSSLPISSRAGNKSIQICTIIAATSGKPLKPANIKGSDAIRMPADNSAPSRAPLLRRVVAVKTIAASVMLSSQTPKIMPMFVW